MRKLLGIPLFVSFIFLGLFFYLIKNSNEEISQEKSIEIEFEEEPIRNLKREEWNHRSVHQLLIQRTRQKKGVYVQRLHPAMDSAALEVVAVFHEVVGDDYVPVITSANDFPGHLRFSKHYENKALDFRIQGLSKKEKTEVVRRVKKKLSSRFTILWESPGTLDEHLHLHLNDE